MRHDLHPVAKAVEIGLTDESKSGCGFGVHRSWRSRIGGLHKRLYHGLRSMRDYLLRLRATTGLRSRALFPRRF